MITASFLLSLAVFPYIIFYSFGLLLARRFFLERRTFSFFVFFVKHSLVVWFLIFCSVFLFAFNLVVSLRLIGEYL